MRLAGRVARMGEIRNAYEILVREPEGKRPFGKTKRRWADNIVLAIGSMVSGFKPGRGDRFLRAIKIRRTPSLEEKVKPSAPTRNKQLKREQRCFEG
jgi:hypothetical protein